MHLSCMYVFSLIYRRYAGEKYCKQIMEILLLFLTKDCFFQLACFNERSTVIYFLQFQAAPLNKLKTEFFTCLKISEYKITKILHNKISKKRLVFLVVNSPGM